MNKINPFIENFSSQLPEGEYIIPLINESGIKLHYFTGSDGYLYTDKYGDLRKVYSDKKIDKDTLISVAIDLTKGLYSENEIAKRNNVSNYLVRRVKNHEYLDIIGNNFEFKSKYNNLELSDQQVCDIYSRSHNGESLSSLAKEYNISLSTARNIYYPGESGRYKKILIDNGYDIHSCKKEAISDELFIEIFNRTNNNESFEKLSKEYGISTRTLTKIKNCTDNYTEYAKRNNIKIPEKVHITDEIVVKVYELSKDGLLDKEIAKETGISERTVIMIRTGARHYREILERNGLNPIRKNIVPIKPNKYSEKEALEIYEELKRTGMSATKMSYMKGCDKSVIADIKYCRRGYDYLQSKYGLKPLS